VIISTSVYSLGKYHPESEGGHKGILFIFTQTSLGLHRSYWSNESRQRNAELWPRHIL